MGDLFTLRRLDAGRSIWTKPLPKERDVPAKRIIHQRVVRLRNLADLRRNVRRLRVDDGVALPGTGPDGAGDGADGGAAGARIDAVSFAVTPPE